MDTGLKEFADLGARKILLNEHNADTKQMEVREGYRHKLLKHWPKIRTQFSSSTIPAKNTYLPGGHPRDYSGPLDEQSVINRE